MKTLQITILILFFNSSILSAQWVMSINEWNNLQTNLSIGSIKKISFTGKNLYIEKTDSNYLCPYLYDIKNIKFYSLKK